MLGLHQGQTRGLILILILTPTLTLGRTSGQRQLHTCCLMPMGKRGGGGGRVLKGKVDTYLESGSG